MAGDDIDLDFDSLVEDIQQKIFSFIPASDVANLRQVQRAWRAAGIVRSVTASPDHSSPDHLPHGMPLVRELVLLQRGHGIQHQIHFREVGAEDADNGELEPVQKNQESILCRARQILRHIHQQFPAGLQGLERLTTVVKTEGDLRLIDAVAPRLKELRVWIEYVNKADRRDTGKGVSKLVFPPMPDLTLLQLNGVGAFLSAPDTKIDWDLRAVKRTLRHLLVFDHYGPDGLEETVRSLAGSASIRTLWAPQKCFHDRNCFPNLQALSCRHCSAETLDQFLDGVRVGSLRTLGIFNCDGDFTRLPALGDPDRWEDANWRDFLKQAPKLTTLLTMNYHHCSAFTAVPGRQGSDLLDEAARQYIYSVPFEDRHGDEIAWGPSSDPPNMLDLT